MNRTIEAGRLGVRNETLRNVAFTKEMGAHRRETLGSRRSLRDGLGTMACEGRVNMRVCAGAGLLEELGSIGRRACRIPYNGGDKRRYIKDII